MEELILSMNPEVSKEECAYRAIFVLSMLEGMMQVLYRDSRNRSDFSAVEERVREQALRIARASKCPGCKQGA